MKDPYAILGVSLHATPEEIKAAYRKMAAIHHPDRNVGKSDADLKFKEAKEAYETLSDAKRRRVYDDSRDKQILSDPLTTGREIWKSFLTPLTMEKS